MVRSIMEGVAFSLLDAMDVIEHMGQPINRLSISGGGAVSRLWRQIIADVFNRPLRITVNREQAGLGAAICAMVACGEYPSVYDACDRIITYEDNVAVPNPDNRGVYEDAFGRFRETYQANKALMHKSREAVQPAAR